MFMRKSLALAALMSGFALSAAASASGVEFPVSFVCGSSPTNDRILAGDFRAMINIKNPTNRTVHVGLELTQTFPLGGAPAAPFAPADPVDLESVTLNPGQAVMIDCLELASGDTPSFTPYTSGVLSVKAPRRTEVVLTQTAGPVAADGTPSNAVSSIVVTQIESVRAGGRHDDHDDDSDG